MEQLPPQQPPGVEQESSELAETGDPFIFGLAGTDISFLESVDPQDGQTTSTAFSRVL